jgi:hypothetical protein
MRSPPNSASTPDSRHPYGPRSLAALLPDVTRPALARRPSAGARIAADWTLIAGARLGAVTQPRKLAAGTLTLACPGPVALEIQHSADLLIERINRHMGQPLVERLRLVQDIIAPPAALPPPRPPTAIDQAAIARRLEGVPEGPLREALASLAAAMQSGR